jgi:hypothetical protein
MNFVTRILDQCRQCLLLLLEAHGIGSWTRFLLLYFIFREDTSVQISFLPVHVWAECLGLCQSMVQLVVARFRLVVGSSLRILVEQQLLPVCLAQASIYTIEIILSLGLRFPDVLDRICSWTLLIFLFNLHNIINIRDFRPLNHLMPLGSKQTLGHQFVPI